MSWSSHQTAPRDRPIWLFLPSAKYESNAAGHPTKVEHLTVVGYWDATHSAWTDRATGHAVYPSMWHSDPVDGPEPKAPDLT